MLGPAAPDDAVPGPAVPGPAGAAPAAPGPPASARGLPAGFRLEFPAGVPALSHGGVLVGGTPLRLFRLSPAGASCLRELLAGRTVGEAGPGAGVLARRLADVGLAVPVPPPPGPDRASVTVAVPVRDRADGVRRLLAGLADDAVTYDALAEVVVVDDGSVDGSGDVATAAGCRVLRHERPRGPAAARNTALAQASTPLVAFLDSDCRPTAGWLGPLLGWLADPAVAAVAPRVAAPAAGPGAVAAYERARSPLDLGRRAAPARPGGRVSYVPAAALLVRRDVVLAAGGFAPGLRYGEDVDLVWRLVAAGWTVRYEPSAVVEHAPRRGPAGLASQRFGYGSSAAPLARRHPGTLRPLAGSLAGVATGAALAAGRPDVAAGLVAGGAARLAQRLGPDVASRGRVAARAAGRAHLRALASAADTLARVWLPPALVASAVSRRARAATAVGLLLPTAVGWARERPRLDPLRYVGLRLLDGGAYCAGVWWGCLRHRTLLPLLPPLRDLRRGAGREAPACSGSRAAGRRPQL